MRVQTSTLFCVDQNLLHLLNLADKINIFRLRCENKIYFSYLEMSVGDQKKTDLHNGSRKRSYICHISNPKFQKNPEY